MLDKKEKKKSGGISRRQFLKDAGIIAGGAAIGTTVLLAACKGGETTKTVTTTTTASGATQTVTSTSVSTVTSTAATTVTAPPTTVSVSQFVCPYCGTEFDTLDALEAHVAAENPAPTRLSVNGNVYNVQLEPQWTLAKVLREKLGLTGTKVGCDIGECGNCTVIMEGKPVYSCLVLATEAEGKDILTIEGLSWWSGGAPKLHPIQQAFVEKDVIQCGWCIPGFIMVAKALLDANPSPTFEQTMEAISGNLCRCNAYNCTADAILLAADKLKEGG